MARCYARALWALFLVGLCAAIARPLGAAAQTVDAERFRKFMNSDFHAALIAHAASLLPKEVFHSCPTLVSPQGTVTLETSVSFAPDGIPNAGAWRERLPVAGCGNDTVLNFRFSVGTDGKINTTVALPGTTHADLALQRDALKYAYIGARSRAKDCERLNIKDTRFGGYGLRNQRATDPGAGDPFRPWWEIWTVVGCGRTFEVPMEFAPDRTGTQIVQTINDVIER